MTYEITTNTQYGSIEVTFDGKPCQAVRDALKLLHFRWHGIKKCWYGFAAESIVRNAILEACEEEDKVITDGYLGASAVYGGKSNKHLSGSDLSAAIRADLKAVGIKGVTVRCKTYAGGQSITATATFTPTDMVTLDEYISTYRVKASYGRLPTADHPEGIHVNTYFAMEGEEQEATRRAAAEWEYHRAATTERTINKYRLDDTAEYTPAFLDKLNAVNKIISAYRYDDSNSMVDYFDTNFYYDIKVKPAEVWP